MTWHGESQKNLRSKLDGIMGRMHDERACFYQLLPRTSIAFLSCGHSNIHGLHTYTAHLTRTCTLLYSIFSITVTVLTVGC